MDPRAVAERALVLFSETAPPYQAVEAAEELGALLRGASARTLRVVERFSRDRRTHDRLAIPFTALRIELLSEHGAFFRAHLGSLAMATMVRSGYVREAAVQMLDDHVEPLALGLLLNRLNDPVGRVAQAASAAVHRHLVHLAPAGVVPYLPLVDALDSWKRSRGDESVAQIEAHLRSATGVEALSAAASHPDPDVRLSVLRRLATHHGESSALVELIRDALAARDPRVRAWGAEAASSLPDELLSGLLPTMADNRTPFIRLAALRAMRGLPQHTARLRRACFDPNANVRFYARRYVKDLDLDHAARARTILESQPASKGELVGALAVLSELGTRDDLELVDRFVGDARVSVAAEASRTAALLTA